MCCNTWTSLISAVANPPNVCLQWVMLGTLQIRERDGSENISQKWICIFQIFIAIIRTHLLRQM